jgi:HAD superfamily hydrolase (TIGR01509 family)
MAEKLIIFDLDGTLCDCRELHYIALNNALISNGQEPIDRQLHLLKFDGLNTNAKLDLLGIVNPELRREIFDDKQLQTILEARNIKKDNDLWLILRYLSGIGFTMCVASNSIKETVQVILQQLGVIEWFDFYLSNEDVPEPKPSKMIYDMAMTIARTNQDNTMIIEDSEIGIRGAEDSGCKVMVVKDRHQLTYKNILEHWEKN